MKIIIPYQLAILLILINCTSAQFRAEFEKHDGFWDWMIGSPGVNGKAGTKYVDPMLEPVDGQIVDKRHPFYLWFRTPEIIFNPQGGIYYPDMIVEHNRSGKFYNTAELDSMENERLKRSILEHRAFFFRREEVGLVEYLIPYREIINGEFPVAVFYCVFSPLTITYTVTKRLFIYPLHDVAKTLMLPVAAVYYTVKAFDGDEDPVE